MFQLTEPTRATISSVTLRREMHGDDRVPAASIGVKIMAPNTLLDQIDPALMLMFYRAPDAPEQQGEFDETRVVHLPLLRSSQIDELHLKPVLDGWTLHIDYGLGDDSCITLGSCKVDKFRAQLQEGGSVELRFRVGSSDVDDVSLGKLAVLIDNEVSITLTAPEKRPDVIDGSRDGDFPFPDAEPEKEAGELFAEMHGDD